MEEIEPFHVLPSSRCIWHSAAATMGRVFMSLHFISKDFACLSCLDLFYLCLINL